MTDQIVITEKSSQAKDVRAAVGSRYGAVLPAEGHLLDLCEPEDVNPAWKRWAAVLLRPEGLYGTKPALGGNKAAKLKAIREALRTAKRVWLATDCDREGQLIGQEILEHCGYRGEVLRVLFTAQDAQTIREAFGRARPNGEHARLYAAAVARRQADQSYNLSLTRTATVTVGRGARGVIGVGRVKTPTLAIACKRELEIRVAIETPSGPVVESLMEHGFAVHSINPKQLDRFRDRFSPAGAKDDRRDARVLASALRTDPHCLRGLEPTDLAIVELREWSRLREELTRERVRLANRMRQQLWRYYPQFLDAVDDDVAAPWALHLWRSLPTPRAGQRVRGVTLTRVLKQHRIRRIDAATLRARLGAPAVKLTPGTVEAATTHVRLIVERLALLNRQLDHTDRQLDRLVHKLAEAAPADAPDASTEDDPDASTALPDAAVLRSLPGIGTKVLATLLAEGSDAVRRRDYNALRCLCGVAPVTRRSGKSLFVTQRRAAHGRLRDAAFHWARVAAQRDPVSHDKYQALRARGHSHARALRSVADRLLNVACAMLRDGAGFDPHRVGRGSGSIWCRR